MKEFRNPRPKKDQILDARKGRTWVTPKNREYQIDRRKEGRKYIIILIYKGNRMQVSESDYNLIPTDTLLDAIEKELVN